MKEYKFREIPHRQPPSMDNRLNRHLFRGLHFLRCFRAVGIAFICVACLQSNLCAEPKHRKLDNSPTRPTQTKHAQDDDSVAPKPVADDELINPLNGKKTPPSLFKQKPVKRRTVPIGKSWKKQVKKKPETKK